MWPGDARVTKLLHQAVAPPRGNFWHAGLLVADSAERLEGRLGPCPRPARVARAHAHLSIRPPGELWPHATAAASAVELDRVIRARIRGSRRGRGGRLGDTIGDEARHRRAATLHVLLCGQREATSELGGSGVGWCEQPRRQRPPAQCAPLSGSADAAPERPGAPKGGARAKVGHCQRVLA